MNLNSTLSARFNDVERAQIIDKCNVYGINPETISFRDFVSRLLFEVVPPSDVTLQALEAENNRLKDEVQDVKQSSDNNFKDFCLQLNAKDAEIERLKAATPTAELTPESVNTLRRLASLHITANSRDYSVNDYVNDLRHAYIVGTFNKATIRKNS